MSLSINNVCESKWDGETEIVTRIIKNWFFPENEVLESTKPTITTKDEQEETIADHIVIPKTVP